MWLSEEDECSAWLWKRAIGDELLSCNQSVHVLVSCGHLTREVSAPHGASPQIEDNRDNDNNAFDDLLIVGGHAQKIENVVNDSNDQTSCQSAGNRADASCKTRATDDCAGNGVKLVTNARSGLSGIQPCHEKNSADR